MKRHSVVIFLVWLLIVAACNVQGAKKGGVKSEQKRVILKLDDIEPPVNESDSIGDRWQRVDAYLASKGIKAAYGIIGYSLEVDRKPYFGWIKSRAASSRVEFWHHGYLAKPINDTLGENMASYTIQLHSFVQTYELAKTKLGLDLSAWGPHWSETNATTDSVLAQCPFIKLTFGSPCPARLYKGRVIAHSSVKIEYPVHNPNFAEFKQQFANTPPTEIFYLQGHPMSWDETRFENFTRIVDFMLDHGFEFVLPRDVTGHEHERK